MTATATTPAAGAANAAAGDDRADTNQSRLVAELAVVKDALRARLDDEGGGRAPGRATGSGSEDDGATSPAVDVIVGAFGMSPFERSVLLMCAGTELDAEIADLCAPGPSFGLALAALPGAHWSALSPDGPLRRWRLLDVAPGGPTKSALLRIDERVLQFLTGVAVADSRLSGLVTPYDGPVTTTASQRNAVAAVTELLRATDQPVPVLCGAERATRAAVAAAAADAMGLRASLLDGALLPADAESRHELARRLERESVLGATVFLVDSDDDATWPAVDAVLALTKAPIAVAADQAPGLRRREVVLVDVPRATAAEQRELWRQAAGDDVDADGLVAAFDLDAATIRVATAAAAGDSTRLWATCRAVDRPRLESHAQRIESTVTWDDLVLPAAERQSLELLAAHARHRVTVWDDWGLRMGRSTGTGSTALFAGSSGTGKTLAAEVVANDLGLDLYRVDLSAVMSKYIGETEKNLRQLFDAADRGAAVLLFDEADALFGKRTEVRDSHDRYANVEVSYLLQRMEAYRGVAILTTNMPESVDAAFLRRLRFVVNFPFPGEAERLELWRRAFPLATPTAELDLEALARLDLAGGTIRNVSVNAAFLAAAAGDVVRMAHVMHAARIESAKLGRPLASLREVREP